MDRATSHARGQCGHMVQCGAHNESAENRQKHPKWTSQEQHHAILVILVLWKHDCLVVQILVLIGWIKLHFNVLVTMSIFAIEAARAGPLHKSALYRVFAGFSVNNLIAWVSVGSNTVTVRARKLGEGGWEYTFATATCTRTKTAHVHNGKGASNPQLSNQAHKWSWFM